MIVPADLEEKFERRHWCSRLWLVRRSLGDLLIGTLVIFLLEDVVTTTPPYLKPRTRLRL